MTVQAVKLAISAIESFEEHNSYKFENGTQFVCHCKLCQTVRELREVNQDVKN